MVMMPPPGFYWISFRDDDPLEWVPAQHSLHCYYGRPGWYLVGDEVPHDIIKVVVGPPIALPSHYKLRDVEG
jgi:hypothetical protein